MTRYSTNAEHQLMLEECHTSSNQAQIKLVLYNEKSMRVLGVYGFVIYYVDES